MVVKFCGDVCCTKVKAVRGRYVKSTVAFVLLYIVFIAWEVYTLGLHAYCILNCI